MRNVIILALCLLALTACREEERSYRPYEGEWLAIGFRGEYEANDTADLRDPAKRKIIYESTNDTATLYIGHRGNRVDSLWSACVFRRKGNESLSYLDAWQDIEKGETAYNAGNDIDCELELWDYPQAPWRGDIFKIKAVGSVDVNGVLHFRREALRYDPSYPTSQCALFVVDYKCTLVRR